MREDVEKFLTDELFRVADKKFDGFEIRKIVEEALRLVDDHVGIESERSYESGFDDGRSEAEWELDDRVSESYSEGYDDGYDTARTEYENAE